MTRSQEPIRISARQFINRLKHADNGEVKLGHVYGNFEIILIITEPAETSGSFAAPLLEAFDYSFVRYSEFIGEIIKLLMTPPEERKKIKTRVQMPWMEGLDDWRKKGNDNGPDQG